MKRRIYKTCLHIGIIKFLDNFSDDTESETHTSHAKWPCISIDLPKPMGTGFSQVGMGLFDWLSMAREKKNRDLMSILVSGHRDVLHNMMCTIFSPLLVCLIY